MSTREASGVQRKRLPAGERRALIARAATELFAERGYRGSSIEEIARHAGVTSPVVYDHFPSKRALYRELLEGHFAELREIWQERFAAAEGSPRQRIAGSLDAWFAYVEAHPFAGRMLFRDTTGDPELAAMHAEVAATSRDAVLPLAGAEPGLLGFAEATPSVALEMLWQVLRGVLQGLAIWWVDHPEVPREQVVATAMNTLWVGLERVRDGEAWVP